MFFFFQGQSAEQIRFFFLRGAYALGGPGHHIHGMIDHVDVGERYDLGSSSPAHMAHGTGLLTTLTSHDGSQSVERVSVHT